jgi:hypothetical protein
MLQKLTYSASRVKTSFYLTGALLLAYCSYALSKENMWLGMLGLLMFGFSAVPPLVYLLDPKRYTITANADGIAICNIFRSYTIPWAEIDHLFVGSVRSINSVAIAYCITAANRPLVSTPALYSASAREIVGAMNRYMISQRSSC